VSASVSDVFPAVIRAIFSRDTGPRVEEAVEAAESVDNAIPISSNQIARNARRDGRVLPRTKVEDA